jgi:hypothetical protein
VTVGGNASNGVPFTVTPYISGLSLVQGPIQMGLVITGTAFGAARGNSTISLGNTPMFVVMWNAPPWLPCSNGANCVTVQIPAGASNGNIVITVNGQASNAVPFTVSPAFCSPSSGCPF